MGGTLLEILSEVAAETSGEAVASEVIVSFPYTGVLSESGLGVSPTILEPPRSLSIEPGTASGRPLGDLLRLASSPLGMDSSLALAAVNSAIQPPPEAEPLDALEAVGLNPSDEVCVIGGFPEDYLAAARRRCRRLWVFERPPRMRRDTLPDWAEEMLVPRCTVLLATGLTVANRTIDRLIELASNAREVALIGPSVPMHPDSLREAGITVAAGARFTDPRGAAVAVREGGGTPSLRRFSEKVVLRL